MLPCYSTITQPGICRKSWKLCPHKNLHNNVHSFIHNWPNLEATTVPFNVVRPGSEASVLKRNELPGHEKTQWRHLTCTWLNERSQSEKATCCLTPAIRHWRRQNYRDNKKIRDGQRVGEGDSGRREGMNRGSREGFYGSEIMHIIPFFLALPHCLWDLSSLTRDWTRATAVKVPNPNH